MEKIAEFCLKLRQAKCIDNGIESGKMVWGHLHEIFVADGHVDEAIISVYKNEQKKSNFKDDLSRIHINTQQSTKHARSTKSIDKIQLGISSNSFFPEWFIKKYPGHSNDQSLVEPIKTPKRVVVQIEETEMLETQSDGKKIMRKKRIEECSEKQQRRYGNG